MKKVLLAVVILIVVAAGALLVLPSFWDWNSEKGRMAALVKKHTGRDLQIAGEVSLRLLPAPAFAARGVTLANIEGGSDAAMIQLEELQVRVALMPLLRGSVRVESVTLVQPEVLLEILPDGRANWELATAPQPQSPGAAAPEATPAEEDVGGDDSFRVDSFIIEDGTVRFRDAVNGRTEVINDLNAELGAESLIGPFVATGKAIYQEVPVEFDFNLDRLVENGATALSLSLGLPRAKANGQFLGALSRHKDLRTLRGRLQARGEDLAALIRGLPLAEKTGALPAQLAQPFDLSAEITGSESEAAADAVVLRLGPLSLDGKVAARFGAVPDIAVELTTKSLDLDKLLASGAPPANPAESERTQGTEAPPAAQLAPPPAAASAAPELPRGVTASVSLAADALLYRGQTVRQLRAAARLADGRLTLEKASAQLPGSSDVSLAGKLSPAASGLRFDGTVEAGSDNLRGLLQWLSIDLPAVSPDRLRRLAFKTGIEAQSDQVTLRNIDLQLDVSRLTGGIAVALRDRPGLGIGVTLDRINLDAYLPDAAAAAPAQAAPQAAPAPGAPPQGAPAAAQPPAGLAVLGSFDANFDIKVGQLTYRGLPLNGLRLDATLQRGGLVVRDFSLDDLAGSRGRFAGSLANVDREPSVDGSLDVSVAALSRLTKLLGLADVGQLPLESFTLSGAVNGNRQEVRFDQRLVALNGSLEAAGRADLKPGAPAIDAALRLDHPDLSVLLGELARDAAVPAGLGPVALEGRLVGSPAQIDLSGLQGEVAGVKLLAGQLGVALGGARPKITADLTTGALPLAVLAAPAAAGKTAGKKSTAKDGAADGGGTARSAGRERWSNKPIDVAALRGVDADVKLHAAEILIDKLRLSKAEVEAVLAGGILDLKRFDGQTYGGRLSLTGRADARETARGGLEVAAAVSATNVEMKELLRDLADTDRFSGPLSLQGNLTSQGLSEAALVSALAGSGRLDGTLTVATKVEEQGAAIVLNLLGQKVKEVRGVTDSTTVLFSSFAGAPSKVDGTFVIEQGVLRSDDLKIRGRDAVALTAGNANLPAWRMESRTDVFRDADPNNAYLTAVLRGPLDSPDVGISGQPFQRREETAPKAVEIPGTTPEPQPLQEQPGTAPPEPEELLREGIKSLLKGLGG